MNKGLTITLIILLSVITVSLIGIFILLLGGKIRFNFNTSKYTEVIVDEEYENIDDIVFNTSTADITIKKSDNDKFRVVIKGLKEKTDVTNLDGKLTIKTSAKKCKFFCINNKIAVVDLYVPESYDKKITINSKYGDIKVDSFENMFLDIDSDYGDIKIEGIKDLKIKSNYGDIKIEYISNYFDIDSDYGDIKINHININKDSYINNDYGDVKINKTNDIKIDSKTSLGDNDTHDSDHNSDITLKVKTSFGDIDIN